ncbi:MAG: FAD-dependent thymidylate synthase [Halanaerobium sp.]|nr:FAD-dependent thymidylate synthase [Halanaerobium sp.]
MGAGETRKATNSAVEARVDLIRHTPEPDSLVAAAARLCYSPVGVAELQEKMSAGKIKRFVKKLIEMGHESPLEHVSFTFALEGVSRTLTHQLVRHRIASYSQQSQRYVREEQFAYIIPARIAEDPELAGRFQEEMERSQAAYDFFVSHLLENGYNEKEAIEEARYVFPNACESKIVVTMNVRSLFNFFSKRCCNRAQHEIKELAWQMLAEVRKISPVLFSAAGPECLRGACPEGSMSCGKSKEVAQRSVELNDVVMDRPGVPPGEKARG